MNRRSLVALLFAAISIIAGCDKDGSTPQNSTNVRSFHAVADAEPLDVLVDDDVKNPAVALGTVSSYANFNSGARIVKIRGTSNAAILSTNSLTFGSSASYTMFLHGRRAALGVMALVDDTTTPAAGKFKIRMVGLAPDSVALDVYIGAADITTSTASITGLTYTTTSDYLELNSGANTLTFAVTGTKEIVFQSAQTFADGDKVTLATYPAVGGGRLVNAALVTGSSATILNNTLSRIKAVNAIPDAPPLNFRADGSLLLSNVPFTASSSYARTNSGNRTLQIEVASVPGSFIATAARQLDPGRDYSVMAVGTLSAPAVVALADDNSVASLGTARMRFVNARPDNVPMDVLVNFASQATNIPARTASAYSNFASGTSYTVTFATVGGVNVVATVETGSLDTTATYSVYLFGSGSTAQAKVVKDR